jgi:hypothetical protein
MNVVHVSGINNAGYEEGSEDAPLARGRSWRRPDIKMEIVVAF